MRDLLVGRVDRVTSVTNVATNFDTEISSNGTHRGVRWHRSTKHFTSLGTGVLSFPDHGDNGSADHVFNETWKEFLGLQIFVMHFHVLLCRLGEFHRNELVTLLLKSLDNLTNETSLDAIRLDLRYDKRRIRIVSNTHWTKLVPLTNQWEAR